MKIDFGITSKICTAILVSFVLASCGTASSDYMEKTTEEAETEEETETEEEAETGKDAETEDDEQIVENTRKEIPLDNSKEESKGGYWFSGKTAEEIISEMSLEQKVSQMLQPACYTADYGDMKEWDLGSVFGTPGGSFLTAEEWSETVKEYQKAALSSDTGIPMVYAQDDVHGINYCRGAVIFPHNIGLGAANDPVLMYKIGAAVADEAKMTGMLWNFAPCLAVSTDPRWGRTYESISSDPEITKILGAAYTKGMTEQGVAACAKHFFADGSETWGTAPGGRLIDRGSAELSEEQTKELLDVYQAQIDAGVQTIMLSYGKVNGIMMHENAEYIRILRENMGFKGLIVTDYEAVQYNTGSTMKDKVAAAINAGVDMLMEPNRYEEVFRLIVEAVGEGMITESRIDEAVIRILQLKIDLGILDDPMQERLETRQKKTGSEEYRLLAEQAVEESLVLLKNEDSVLPIKENIKVYVTGPAANDDRVQCGGWTQAWQGAEMPVEGSTTILQGLINVGAKKNITILTDPSDAPDADITLLFVGERPYAEWHGDSRDLSLTGNFGLAGNGEAIREAKRLRNQYGIPTAACIVAGRHVMISSCMDDWDALVMCYLPGTEGQGVANVLMGDAPFHGTLPMPWYDSVDHIGSDTMLFSVGNGIVGAGQIQKNHTR